MKDSVCAVVVTFNRRELLIKCMDSLINQTIKPQAIYIVDNNSTDNTPELLYEKEYIIKLPQHSNNIEYTQTTYENVIIKYIHLPENIGGAGGFHYGVKEAYQDNYDWIWIMDDDALPTENCLEKLKPHFHHENTVALASLEVDMNDNILFLQRGYANLNRGLSIFGKYPITKKDTEVKIKDIDIATFVGLIVSKEAVSKIGFPKKEFFIHHDDTEYCIRLKSIGKIKLINDSIIKHDEGSIKDTVYKSFLGIKRGCRPLDKLWINYYAPRNIIWIGRKYCRNKLFLYLEILKNYILTIGAIIIFDDNKYKRIRFFTNAYIDGFKSNFDNNKPRKLLDK